jgi:hypothetical protein
MVFKGEYRIRNYCAVPGSTGKRPTWRRLLRGLFGTNTLNCAAC